MLGGQRADFRSWGAFWGIRSSGLLRCFCVTGAALRMTWPHFFMGWAILLTDGGEKSQNALVQGRQLCTPFRFSIQNCFVFDVANFENGKISQNFVILEL
jgi:hypothetical protein